MSAGHPYRMRNSSLGHSSFKSGSLHPASYEKSVAESAYHLQHPAYDCNLHSLSSNNS